MNNKGFFTPCEWVRMYNQQIFMTLQKSQIFVRMEFHCFLMRYHLTWRLHTTKINGFIAGDESANFEKYYVVCGPKWVEWTLFGLFVYLSQWLRNNTQPASYESLAECLCGPTQMPYGFSINRKAFALFYFQWEATKWQINQLFVVSILHTSLQNVPTC